MGQINTSKGMELIQAAVTRSVETTERNIGGGVFHFKCYDKNGNLKWEDIAKNLVTGEGIRDLLIKYFTGTSYTAVWYLGLYGSGASNTPAYTDTMASHPGWVENTNYSNIGRPSISFVVSSYTVQPSQVFCSAGNTASLGGTPCVFYINASTTIGGAFLTTNSFKGAPLGTLFSAADFFNGDRNLISGDQLNVEYIFTQVGL